MRDRLREPRFDFVSPKDKAFLEGFDDAMAVLGYDDGGAIGSGYCWGRYMVVYGKSGTASRRVLARVYLRDDGIVLRLFLNGLDRHRAFLEGAPAHVRDVFTGPRGDCGHCRNEKEGACRFRKTYTLDGRLFEKCNGLVFEFPDPDLARLPDYLALLREFAGGRKT